MGLKCLPGPKHHNPCRANLWTLQGLGWSKKDSCAGDQKSSYAQFWADFCVLGVKYQVKFKAATGPRASK